MYIPESAAVPVTISDKGVILDGPNRGARSWDVHAARANDDTK